MNNMECWNCSLKHLAASIAYGKELKTYASGIHNPAKRIKLHLSASLSYMKEILSGHSKDASLDHRADFLGEIVIAESMIPDSIEKIRNELTEFRRDLQDNDTMPARKDYDFLHEIYGNLENCKTDLEIIDSSDFLGELINAENHLQMLNPNYAFQVGKIRAAFQDNNDDYKTDLLRLIWAQIDKIKAPNESATLPVVANGKKKKRCKTCGGAKYIYCAAKKMKINENLCNSKCEKYEVKHVN